MADLSGGTWNDIVVTNNEGGGTIVVLEPAARPVPTSAPEPNDFPVTVNVPNPAAVTGLTVTLALTASLADLELTLIAPDGETITLANPGLTGTALGAVSGDEATSPAIDPVVFDDNATRNIIDSAGLTPLHRQLAASVRLSHQYDLAASGQLREGGRHQ